VAPRVGRSGRRPPAALTPTGATATLPAPSRRKTLDEASDATPPDGSSERGTVEIDGVRALGTQLSRVDGRVGTLADQAASGPLLVVVVEHTCPTARAALRALTSAGGRLAVVSQGRPEAAWSIVEATQAHHLEVWVEPAPHRVSEALAATTVPTFVLFEGLEPVAWEEAWDAEVVASLVSRAGGELTVPEGLGAFRPGCSSRLGHEAVELARLEADDTLLVAPRERGDDAAG
jgi:hypothetical protein